MSLPSMAGRAQRRLKLGLNDYYTKASYERMCAAHRGILTFRGYGSTLSPHNTGADADHKRL